MGILEDLREIYEPYANCARIYKGRSFIYNHYPMARIPSMEELQVIVNAEEVTPDGNNNGCDK